MKSAQGIVYLGSPYSAPSEFSDFRRKHLQTLRYEFARKTVAELLVKHRLHVYSPIVHCHDLAEQHDLPTDFEFWKNYNFSFLEVSQELIVLKLPGWENSIGLREEIVFAQQNLLPITYVRWTEGVSEPKLIYDADL